jgi:hypothetical protein
MSLLTWSILLLVFIGGFNGATLDRVLGFLCWRSLALDLVSIHSGFDVFSGSVA